MYVRLGFSVAINVDPDILLIDEVLAVGDAEFQRKCMEKIDEFRQSGKTVVIVSHAVDSVRNLCRPVAVARARRAPTSSASRARSSTSTSRKRTPTEKPTASTAHGGGTARRGSRRSRCSTGPASPSSASAPATRSSFRFHYKCYALVRDPCLVDGAQDPGWRLGHRPGHPRGRPGAGAPRARSAGLCRSAG